MSEIAQAATVDLVLADFAANDAGGKGNIVGAGVAGLGFDPAQGVSSRFSLWVAVHVPTALLPAEFPVELALVDAAGDLVLLPSLTGGVGQSLRVAQMVQAEKPPLVFNAAQREHIGGRIQMVFDFGNGLPLAAGGVFNWRLRVDGDDTRTWSYPFAVAGPPAAPVMG